MKKSVKLLLFGSRWKVFFGAESFVKVFELLELPVDIFFDHILALKQPLYLDRGQLGILRNQGCDYLCLGYALVLLIVH